MNVRTFELLPNINKSADFETNSVDCQRDLGYSVGITIANATSLNCTIHLFCSTGNDIWSEVSESHVVIKTNEVLNYNVSECYYSDFKVVVEMKSGSADFNMYVTTKSN